ncbi:MAG TPA: CrcB family protein [Terrimesophilobacter sp.]|nr:CrcB family protein [Terrimesophilobacter sp.]
MPIDPAPNPARAGWPAYLRWRYIGLVVIGGTFGTAARFTLTEAVPTWSGVPVATFGVNILGAFLLGVLVTNLARRGRDEGVRRAVRLLLGTGFMGGFTTYSTLAVETDALFRSGQAGLAVAYATATVIIGALAAATGIRIASRRQARDGGR